MRRQLGITKEGPAPHPDPAIGNPLIERLGLI
jgi:hypothetical protein